MLRPQSLYWIGLYEPICSKKWEWFFQVDVTRAICYCYLRFTGGGEGPLHLGGCSRSPVTLTVTDTGGIVIGVLFAIQGTLVVTSLSSVPIFLLAHFLPRISLDLWLGVYVLFTVCVHLAWSRVSLIVNVIASRFDGLTN